MPAHPARNPIVCDVSAFTVLDIASLHALAQAQLLARRHGTAIELANASIEVRDLLTALGLAEVLPIVGSGVREIVPVDGKVEEREEVRIDEVVDRDDPAV